ncbi:glycosyltransferase family 2 protein [Jiella mangrovi]|uniref:Glycosyltransferase family 2 protein n=1 Tax=Jiella mangrovi TaxID=2821407 RepID=A0ABS4BIS0_9HYPH|nr:glycosyltransferase family 2 protein [Jiella mangrovi]MBP0616659.1 glycosyltransferase family 2 protein [Jiella mangrovi]
MQNAALMMQKNEGAMLQIWLRHHAEIFGNENLYVFDNGSTDEQTLQVLRQAAQSGVNVSDAYSAPTDFDKKGEIIKAKIEELAKLGRYSFFFPLDADELVGAMVDGHPSFKREDVNATLAPFVGEQRVLRIARAYVPNPTKEGLYALHEKNDKCFFYTDTIAKLDIGFHSGETKSGKEGVITDIIQVHAHHKKYESKQVRSLQKLQSRFGRITAAQAVIIHNERDRGWHLISDVLRGRGDFYRRHSAAGRQASAPQIRDHLSRLGLWNEFAGLMDFGYDRDAAASDLTARGTIEDVSLADGVVRISGWAVKADGSRFESFYLNINGVNRFVVPHRLVRRQDVVRATAGADLFCGFEIENPVGNPEDRAIRSLVLRPIDLTGDTYANFALPKTRMP